MAVGWGARDHAATLVALFGAINLRLSMISDGKVRTGEHERCTHNLKRSFFHGGVVVHLASFRAPSSDFCIYSTFLMMPIYSLYMLCLALWEAGENVDVFQPCFP